MDLLWEFIARTCIEQNIDESHGLKHSKGCVAWVERLLLGEEMVTEDERMLAIYAAALHDMCDKKYTDVGAGLEKIRLWLLEIGWADHLVKALLNIINTTSYSKLKASMVNGKIVYPDHGPYNRVYHIVRQADLLEAYIVGRCFIYQKHIVPDISDDDCWRSVRELFDKRVFKYVSDGWITNPIALSYVVDLERKAYECFDKRNYDYRSYDYRYYYCRY